MASISGLEDGVRRLIAKLKNLQQKNRELAASHSSQSSRVAELEAECRQLRVRIDELDRDRVLLRQLKEERKVMRRKLETAVDRLTAIEGELP